MEKSGSSNNELTMEDISIHQQLARRQTEMHQFKGVFQQNEALSKDRYNTLLQLAQSLTYGYRKNPAVSDKGIGQSPPYCRQKNIRTVINELLLDLIKQNGMYSIFNVCDDCPFDSFILKYTAGDKYTTALTTHRDSSENQACLSAIYSIEVGANGGGIAISDRLDGNLVYPSKHSTDYRYLTPPDNSIYGFNGHYAAHRGVNIEAGVRYAFVGFFKTRQTREEVVRLWNYKNRLQPYICLICAQTFGQERKLKAHTCERRTSNLTKKKSTNKKT
jgi:hypothetical protein